MAACGGSASSDKTALSAPPKLGGKTDASMPEKEIGFFRGAQGERSYELDGRTIYLVRFNTFGNAKVKIDLSSPGWAVDPAVLVDGPVTAGSQGPFAIVDWNDDATPDTLDSSLELSLKEPGAYRIAIGTTETFDGKQGNKGKVNLKFTCSQGCTVPQLPLPELIAMLEGQLGKDGLRALLEAATSQLFVEPGLVSQITGQLDAFLAAPASGIPFPVVPLSAIAQGQGFLEAPDVTPPAPGPMRFDVADLLADCNPERASLTELNPALPGLQTGSVPNLAIDDCTLGHSRRLAEVLNNLALNNGTVAVYDGTEFRTIREVIQGLIASGHHIVVDNDRFFADFLGLSFNGAAVMAPLWIDTGLPLKDGSTLILPSPHTHHTISIEGPLVRAQLMYYMGISGGVSFRADANLRPPWTERRTRYSYDSAVDPEGVVQLFELAGDLRARWSEAGRGLPAEGYGQLGVCNDSTAVLEWNLEGSASIYPLVHETPVATGDPVVDALATLPYDLPTGAPLTQSEIADAFRRVRATLISEDPSKSDFPFLAQELAQIP